MEVSMETGNRLAYEDRGTGFPVVFVHGLTFSKETWRPVIDCLVDRCRCVTIDLPGHGESVGHPESMEEVAEQVHRVVVDLGLTQPVIVGHSYGAMFATFYAAQMPVAGVVSVDQTLLVGPVIRMAQQMEPILRESHFKAAFEPILQSMGVEMLPEPVRTRTLATQTVRQDLVVTYWYDMGHASPEEMQAMVDEATAKIRVPYLAIFGHRLPEADRTHLHDHLSTLELEEWPDHGHMIHLMETQRFADRLARFIDRCAER